MSAALPSSPSSAVTAAVTRRPADVRVSTCARHERMEGTHHCTACQAPLCSACSRSADHRRCPSCRVAQGQAPTRTGAAWFITLWWDALAVGVPALHRSALPLLVVLSVVLTTWLPAVEGDPMGMVWAGQLMESALAVVLLATLRVHAVDRPDTWTGAWRAIMVALALGLVPQALALMVGAGLAMVVGSGMAVIIAPLMIGAYLAGLLSAPLEGAVVLEHGPMFRLGLLRASRAALGTLAAFVFVDLLLRHGLNSARYVPLAEGEALTASPAWLVPVVGALALRLVLGASFRLAAARFMMDASRIRAAEG